MKLLSARRVLPIPLRVGRFQLDTHLIGRVCDWSLTIQISHGESGSIEIDLHQRSRIFRQAHDRRYNVVV